jgi:hypothetical protein
MWVSGVCDLTQREPGDETMTTDRWNQNDIDSAAAWYVAHSTDAEIQAELDLAFRSQCGYMIHILMHAKAARAAYR